MIFRTSLENNYIFSLSWRKLWCYHRNMEKRSCPKCHETLGDHDGYFCSSCGEKLPKDLVRTNKVVRIRTYSPSEPAVTQGPATAQLLARLKDKTFWMIFGLVLFIFVVFVSIANTGIVELAVSKLSLGPEFEKLSLSLPKSEPSSSIVNLSISVGEGVFGENDFTQSIPAEADFYFEGTNLSQFLSLNLFDKKDEDFSPKAKILLEPQFAGFSYSVGDENRWGFLFIPKDAAIAQDVFGNGWGGYWKIAFLPDYMILANNEDVFDVVKSVYGGLNLSLAQNPDYVKEKKGLLSYGQLQVYFMSAKGKNIVRGSMGGFTQETIGMINKVLSSSHDSLVITNTNGEK